MSALETGGDPPGAPIFSPRKVEGGKERVLGSGQSMSNAPFVTYQVADLGEATLLLRLSSLVCEMGVLIPSTF